MNTTGLALEFNAGLAALCALPILGIACNVGTVNPASLTSRWWRWRSGRA